MGNLEISATFSEDHEQSYSMLMESMTELQKLELQGMSCLAISIERSKNSVAWLRKLEENQSRLTGKINTANSSLLDKLQSMKKTGISNANEFIGKISPASVAQALEHLIEAKSILDRSGNLMMELSLLTVRIESHATELARVNEQLEETAAKLCD